MDENLQFEKADFQNAPAQTCKGCNGSLTGAYFQANGAVFCNNCAEGVRKLVAGRGTRAGRFLRALLYGLGAAILGSAVYYGIRAATGYEIGLVAIVVGVIVGKAVRAGSGNRGGWRYQVLAALLTYASIASTYVPLAISAVQHRESLVPRATAPATQGRENPDSPADTGDRPTSATAGKSPQPHTAIASWIAGLPRPLRMAVAIGFLTGIALALPFLAGLQNVIGLVIIAIGVWEAWKLNTPLKIEVTGPHFMSSSGA